MRAVGALEDALEDAQRQADALRGEHDASQRRTRELLDEWQQLAHVREQLRAAADEREANGALARLVAWECR